MLLSDEHSRSSAAASCSAMGPPRPRGSSGCETPARTFFEITITEGRNRQVRRMVEALGAKVLKLVRTRIGTLEIGGLPIGSYRTLSAAEVKALAGGVKPPPRPRPARNSPRLPRRGTS